MPLLSETYWIYRDNYPAKRFIGADAGQKARLFAEQLSMNYPGSVVSCSLQKMWETEVFKIPAKIIEQVKELRDA